MHAFVLRARFQLRSGIIAELLPVPATAVTDPDWLAVQLDANARRFRLPGRAANGVLWWYSASSVLLGPPAETYVRGGPAADPGLESLTLFLHPDGRVLDARAASTVDRFELPVRVGAVLEVCVDAVAAASGAAGPALWAIATDSLANRVLWAGGSAAAALELAADPRLPRPRYVEVAGTRAVRRASCCLIYEAPGQRKCASCPRQHPDERQRRLRAALG